ncbi:Uncharacterized protein HZ326_21983 [Fusarium oxysporum f. sp. albedinis]|nr:Uncharacterized protein HZ326_21983 [Fusarium oxysporum f. sp. albedinis]
MKAFVRRNREGAHRTRPKGYDANYVGTELLRLLKNEVVKKVHDEIFMAEDGQLKIIESSRTLPPFLSLSQFRAFQSLTR